MKAIMPVSGLGLPVACPGCGSESRIERKSLWLAAALWLAGLARLACGDEPLPLVDLSLTAVETRNLGDHPGHQGHVFQSRQATFLLSDVYYAIRYCACVDKAHGGRVAPLEGYLGMPEPSACNWYHSGFLFILVNGQDIGTTPLAHIMVAERGRRAILDFAWRAEAGDVRARFLGLPHRDYLAAEITVEPKTELRSLAVRLTCYPSYFTHAYHRDGARRVYTPRTVVPQGTRVTLPAKDHWWCLYADEVFDPAKGEGEGPCAMLVLPEMAAEIALDPGGYAVGTRITCPPGSRRIRLAFWDFRGKTNAEALARLRTGADDVRKELAALDFTPAGLKDFDLDAVRTELQRAVKSEPVRAALGRKAAEIQAWLDQYAAAQTKGKTSSSIEAEAQRLEAIQRYQDLSWDVKLAELLSTL